MAETKLFNKQRELGAALHDLQKVAERIKPMLGEGDPSTAKADHSELAAPSSREREILAALVRGERNSIIAARLQLSPKSVSTYRSRIFEKLKVESVAQLVRLVSSAATL